MRAIDCTSPGKSLPEALTDCANRWSTVSLGSDKIYSHQEEQYSHPPPKSAWLLSGSLCNAKLYWDLMDHSYTHALLSKTCPGLSDSSSTSPSLVSLSPCKHSLNILCHYHKIQFCSWKKPWKSRTECCLHNWKTLSGSWHYMRNCIIQWGMRSEEPYSVYKSFTQKTTMDTKQKIVWIQKKKNKWQPQSCKRLCLYLM